MIGALDIFTFESPLFLGAQLSSPVTAYIKMRLNRSRIIPNQYNAFIRHLYYLKIARVWNLLSSASKQPKLIKYLLMGVSIRLCKC